MGIITWIIFGLIAGAIANSSSRGMTPAATA